MFPPLSLTAGLREFTMEMPANATLEEVIENLIARFGEKFRLHLYDERGKIIPSWSVFRNKDMIQLNKPSALSTKIEDGDTLGFILNIAGGAASINNAS